MNNRHVNSIAIILSFFITINGFAMSEIKPPSVESCLSGLVSQKTYAESKKLILEMEAETDKRIKAYVAPYWDAGELISPPAEMYTWASTQISKNSVGPLERSIYHSIRRPLEKYYAFDVSPSDYFLVFDDPQEAVNFISGQLSEMANHDSDATTILQKLSVRWEDRAGHILSIHIEQTLSGAAVKKERRVLIINEDTGYARILMVNEGLAEQLGMDFTKVPGPVIYLPESADRN